MRWSHSIRSLVLAAVAAIGVAGSAEARPVVITAGFVPPPPPAPVVVVQPLRPTPAHVWVQGQWAWNGYRYVWAPGYWAPTGPAYYPQQVVVAPARPVVYAAPRHVVVTPARPSVAVGPGRGPVHYAGPARPR